MDAVIIVILVLWAVFGAGMKKANKKPAAGRRLRDLQGHPSAQDQQPVAPTAQHRKPVAPAAPKPDPAVPFAPRAAERGEERRPFFYTQADYDGRADECPACTPEETPDEEREAALTFDFSANEIVRGFVYSEIFGNRPGAEEREWTPFAR